MTMTPTDAPRTTVARQVRAPAASATTRSRLSLYLWTAVGVIVALHAAVAFTRLVFDGHSWSRVFFDVPGLVRLVTVVALVAGALSSRAPFVTPRRLAVIDGGATLWVSLVGVAGFVGAPPGLHPELSLLMLVSLLLSVRAALVPSSRLRTLAVSLLALTPIVVAAPLFVAPDAYVGTVPLMRIVLVTTAAFAAATAGVATLTSHVIYRLQRQVRAARRLGPYELGEMLGEGGMGTVHRARHTLMPRPVALKLVRPELLSERGLARFEQEAHVTGQLSHPNIVAVHEYGETADGTRFVAMELVDGVSLDQVIAREGPLAAVRALGILKQLAAGLAHAHGSGLIHRDIKPANIMLVQREGHHDLVKILDFGLASRFRAGEDGGDTTLVGTPMFMAPEAIVGDGLSPAVDVYAAGALAYALLTGEYLFAEHEGHRQRLFAAHLRHPPLPPSLRREAPLPRDLEDIVMRCLKKSPDERYPDGAALLTALRACELPEESDSVAVRPGSAARPHPMATSTSALPLTRRHALM